MTIRNEAATAMTTPTTTVPPPATTVPTPPTAASTIELTPVEAWSRRVRRIGGLIQAAFAAFWLVRASLAIGGRWEDILIAVSGVAVIAVFTYAIRVTGGGIASRPAGTDARRLERLVTIATIAELVAAFVLPVIVIAAGHSDWVLPSIVITIGPLLLYLDHLVHIPRYRLIGWLMTAGPVVLVATMSGSVLEITTGIAAGVLLLATAAAGFHDLAGIRRSSSPGPAGLGTRG